MFTSSHHSRRISGKEIERKREGGKRQYISATVLVIANESGGARRGKRENGMRAEKRHREGERKKETSVSGRERETRGGLCSYGSRYIAE